MIVRDSQKLHPELDFAAARSVFEAVQKDEAIDMTEQLAIVVLFVERSIP